MTSTAQPGLFAGWRLDRGLKYRGVLQILDYELARSGNFSMRSVRNIPFQEVHFPEVVEFPFAEVDARLLEIYPSHRHQYCHRFRSSFHRGPLQHLRT